MASRQSPIKGAGEILAVFTASQPCSDIPFRTPFFSEIKKSMVATRIFIPFPKFVSRILSRECDKNKKKKLGKSKSPTIRIEETTKRGAFCHLDASSEFHKVVVLSILEKERDTQTKHSGKLPKQRSFRNYVTKPARPFISPTRSLIARHLSPSLHPPFSRTL